MNLKAVDPKEKPKLIALIVVAIIIFGFSGFQIVTYNSAQGKLVSAAKAEAVAKQQADTTVATRPSSTTVPSRLHGDRPSMSPSIAPTVLPTALAAGEHPSPSAGASATPRAPGTPLAMPTPAVSGIAGVAGIPVMATQSQIAMAPPVRGKDPFLPTGRFAEPTKPTPSPSSAPLPPIKQGLHVPEFGDMVTATETTQHGPTIPAMPTPAPVLLPLPSPSPPPYTVTGVVVADRDNPRAIPIAVLRSSGPIGMSAGAARAVGTASANSSQGASAMQADRRFVTIGDPVGNGFVVAAVRADGVDLRSGNRLVTLKIGMANGNLK